MHHLQQGQSELKKLDEVDSIAAVMSQRELETDNLVGLPFLRDPQQSQDTRVCLRHLVKVSTHMPNNHVPLVLIFPKYTVVHTHTTILPVVQSHQNRGLQQRTLVLVDSQTYLLLVLQNKVMVDRSPIDGMRTRLLGSMVLHKQASFLL